MQMLLVLQSDAIAQLIPRGRSPALIGVREGIPHQQFLEELCLVRGSRSVQSLRWSWYSVDSGLPVSDSHLSFRGTLIYQG
jgi:hypothetical protein